jgi:hypothetical protein
MCTYNKIFRGFPWATVLFCPELLMQQKLFMRQEIKIKIKIKITPLPVKCTVTQRENTESKEVTDHVITNIQAPLSYRTHMDNPLRQKMKMFFCVYMAHKSQNNWHKQRIPRSHSTT